MSRTGRALRTVTVISPTLSGNALFRTQMLVRLLRTRFDVQLIGFDQETTRFAALQDDDATKAECAYYASNVMGWWLRVRSLRAQVRGQVLVCVKPLLTSFGAGLVLGRALKRPVVLDVDDWEPGFLSLSAYWEARLHGPSWLFSTRSPLFTRLLNGEVPRASAVTVSSSFLQGMYGGHWLPHARADDFGLPTRESPTGKQVVLFAGAPRGHKGLSTLLLAWKHLAPRNATLRLILSDKGDGSFSESGLGSDVEVLGPVPFSSMPAHVASASVVVVPQENAPGAVGQLPMKLIDAMAAGRAIVATDVSDAARWLASGAGIVVPPGSPIQLAEGLRTALSSDAIRRSLGRAARERFLAWAAESVLAPRLCHVVEAAAAGVQSPATPAFCPTGIDHEPQAADKLAIG